VSSISADQFLGADAKSERVFKGKLRVTGVDTSVTNINSGSLRSHQDHSHHDRSFRDKRQTSSRTSSKSGDTRNSIKGTGVRRRMYYEDETEFDTPWKETLADPTSQDYLDTVEAFRKRMDHIYSTSLLRKAFMRSEILGLDR